MITPSSFFITLLLMLTSSTRGLLQPFLNNKVRRTIRAAGYQSMSAQSILLPKVIVITGPTAVGKSKLALNLCREMPGEIISVDSVQVYRKLDIGSNKATKEERAEIPHHLLDVLDADADEAFTAGDFVRKAQEAIDDVLSREKVPVVVGGTSMYTQWLVQGPPDAPKSDPKMEQQAREILSPFQAAGDWEGAYAIVARYNEPRVAKIAKNDWYRLERALEVFLMTPGDQETYTGIKRALDSKYDFRCFFLIAPREPLNRIIDVRCVQMVERGLLEETSELLINGILNAASPPGRAIGYRQAIEYLKRPIDKEEEEEEEGGEEKALESFLEDFATATRRYAKSQMTWYRAQEEFVWIRWDLSDMQSVKELVHACYTEGREEHEARRKGEEQKHLREENVKEGKKMKVYQSKILEVEEGERWTALLGRAVECRRRVLAEGIEGEVGR